MSTGIYYDIGRRFESTVDFRTHESSLYLFSHTKTIHREHTVKHEVDTGV